MDVFRDFVDILVREAQAYRLAIYTVCIVAHALVWTLTAVRTVRVLFYFIFGELNRGKGARDQSIVVMSALSDRRVKKKSLEKL